MKRNSLAWFVVVCLSALTYIVCLRNYSVVKYDVRFNNTRNSKNPFLEAFKSVGTDKYHTHGYHRFYMEFLRGAINEPVRLLEIGAYNGQSLRAWRNVFSNSVIYAVAYGDHNVESDPPNNIYVIDADQSNCTDLALVKSIIKTPLDIVIDDGSHVPEHVVKTLVSLFPMLKPGGYYIIEDVETSYWDKPDSRVYGYSLPFVGAGRPGSVVEVMKLLIEVVNQRYATPSYNKSFFAVSRDLDPHVSFVAFAQNMVILRKNNNDDVLYHVPAAIQSSSGQSWQEFWRSNHVQAVMNQTKGWLCRNE